MQLGIWAPLPHTVPPPDLLPDLKQYGVAIHTYHDTWNKLPNNPNIYAQNGNWGAPSPSWQGIILPQMEQQPLYDKIIWNWNAPTVTSQVRGYAQSPGAGTWSAVAGTNGVQFAEEIQVPYSMCPSDSTPSLGIDSNWQAAQTSYSGSLGSQATTSNRQSCNIFYTNTATIIYQELLPGGNPDHGNTTRQDQLSGVFNRWGLKGNLNFGAVRDGTSNTIFVGEVIGECHDHWDGGWWRTEAG